MSKFIKEFYIDYFYPKQSYEYFNLIRDLDLDEVSFDEFEQFKDQYKNDCHNS